MNEESKEIDVAQAAADLLVELCQGDDKSPEMVAAIAELLRVLVES